MSNRVKYGRTFHVPWSEGYTSDDKVFTSMESFSWRDVVITEKLDGENTSIYFDDFHARSINDTDHPSRNWLKQWHSVIKFNIPEGYRICGENVYAKHSIAYDDLESYFYGFSMWDNNNVCLSWDETLEWFKEIGIIPVKTLYRGIYDERKIRNLNLDSSKQEGYVIRLCNSFSYDDFDKSLAKYVRKNHVQTDDHWRTSEIIPNKLRLI